MKTFLFQCLFTFLLVEYVTELLQGFIEFFENPFVKAFFKFFEHPFVKWLRDLGIIYLMVRYKIRKRSEKIFDEQKAIIQTVENNRQTEQQHYEQVLQQLSNIDKQQHIQQGIIDTLHYFQLESINPNGNNTDNRTDNRTAPKSTPKQRGKSRKKRGK